MMMSSGPTGSTNQLSVSSLPFSAEDSSHVQDHYTLLERQIIIEVWCHGHHRAPLTPRCSLLNSDPACVCVRRPTDRRSAAGRRSSSRSSPGEPPSCTCRWSPPSTTAASTTMARPRSAWLCPHHAYTPSPLPSSDWLLLFSSLLLLLLQGTFSSPANIRQTFKVSCVPPPPPASPSSADL